MMKEPVLKATMMIEAPSLTDPYAARALQLFIAEQSLRTLINEELTKRFGWRAGQPFTKAINENRQG